MSKKIAHAAAAAFLTVTAPAHAALIQWNLDNVTEQGNPSVTLTGFFDCDTVANVAAGLPTGFSPNFSITELGGGPSLTWSSLNSNSPFDFSSLGPRFTFVGDGLTDGLGELIIDPNNSFDGSVPTLPLVAGSFLLAQDCSGGQCTNRDFLPLAGSLTATDISAVPLPAALPLFGSGVMMLAGFAARRGGKVFPRRG
jgi:hypothetical protein